MKLLLKQSFKSITKHLIQFLCVFFMILLSVVVFVSSNSNTESLRNGFDKIKKFTNYRDANTINTLQSVTGNKTSYGGGAYNYVLDTYYDNVKDLQNRSFRLYNSPFNQLIWGANLDSATNLPDGNSGLYAYLVSLDPSFANFKKDFIPTFINSTAKGEKVFVSTAKDPVDPHDPYDSFWKVPAKLQANAIDQIRNYLKKIYEDIRAVSRNSQRYVSLTDFLIRYFYNDPNIVKLPFDKPSFTKFADNKKTQNFAKGLVNKTNINALPNQNINQGIGSRQLFSFDFQIKGVTNNFLFVNNSQYIDKTYTNVKFNDLAQAKNNDKVLLSKNYINGNNYKDGSQIALDKNGAVLGNVKVGGIGYITETLIPAQTRLFGLSFFNPNVSSTAIVNNATYYQLHQRLTITNDTGFSTIKYNNRVNKNFQLGALNNFLDRYLAKPYFPLNKPVPQVRVNTTGPVQSSSYGKNRFNISYANFPSIISNSDTFIFTFLAILLSITGVVLIFIVKRQCDSMRKTLGILKASGYSSIQLSSVFLGFTFTASVLGSLIGTGIGWLVGLWITSQSLVNYLGPFPNFVYSNLSLFAPLGIVTVTLLIFSFFTSIWILRINADKLMRPGSDISTSKIIIFFQYFVRKTSFTTRFRFATILLAPFKTGIIFLSFFFSSFLLIFSIFGFSLFQNVVNSTLNGLNYKYSYRFQTSTSLLDRYLMLSKEGVKKYLPKQNALINGDQDGHNTSSAVNQTQALRYDSANNAITYNGNQFKLNNTMIALFADTGSFYDSKGNFTSLDKWGLSGMYLDKNTFNSIFDKAPNLTFNKKLAAWAKFLPQLTNSLYGSVTPPASAKPTLAAINTLKANFGGTSPQTEFLNRSLTFDTLANTTYLQFKNSDLYKLIPLLSQGIAIKNPDQTVDLNFVRYDNNDLPYFTEKVTGFAKNGKATSLNVFGINQDTNKLNQFYKTVNQSTFDDNATLQGDVLGVVVNQFVASRLQARVGSIVNTDFKINNNINSSRGSPNAEPSNLKIKILQIIPGYFGSQVFTQYNSFAKIYASHIEVADKKNLNVATAIRNGIPTDHAVYNGFFSKSSDNLATLNTPVYTKSPQNSLFAYFLNITSILSLNDIQKFIQEAQSLFVLVLSLILALTCVISLIIIIATTNIILNDFKNNIVIMKLFGYNDLKVSWLIMSVFLFIIIIAFLLAILAVVLVYRWLTQFLYNAINVQIEVIYTFQGFLLCISIIVFLFILSFLLNWFAIKRIRLVESLNKD